MAARRWRRGSVRRAMSRGLKTVLFCGGRGLRMNAGMLTPKPLVRVGGVPILIHLMRYYACWGHKTFILCLGHRSDAFVRWFADRQSPVDAEVVHADGNGTRTPVRTARAGDAWRVTLVETGDDTTLADRLAAVRPLLADELTFLANYGDGLTDFPLPRLETAARAAGAIAAFIAVPPPCSFHVVSMGPAGRVSAIAPASAGELLVNGGFFVMTREIFDHLRPGDELVEAPFQRLLAQRRLVAVPHRGFWIGIDTPKEVAILESMIRRGETPWEPRGSLPLRRPPARATALAG